VTAAFALAFGAHHLDHLAPARDEIGEELRAPSGKARALRLCRRD
jgi:hypothetical protein